MKEVLSDDHLSLIYYARECLQQAEKFYASGAKAQAYKKAAESIVNRKKIPKVNTVLLALF